MQRRDFIAGAAAIGAAWGIPGAASGAATADTQAGVPFDPAMVRARARDLASKPYQAPDAKLPDALAHLDYDQYRTIRFDPRQSLWRGTDLPFEVQFFHLGFLFTTPVVIHEVADGRARRIRYSPDLFDMGVVPRTEDPDLGFAGFRLHAPINRPDYKDEVCAFLGASYFRAVAKNQGYGLSARGLAIKTGDPGGEEFPLFREFWLERPTAGVMSIVVHALLDSPSAAAAYRFTIRPGDETVFDVEMALYPRADLDQAGIAPMTSMFYVDANDRPRADDYRPAVHDSNGLAIATGRGEQIWRPLANPAQLQLSAFADTNPRGFGLMQRKRDFRSYDDLEAHYEKRPSLWAEPIGNWGEGAVQLVEIPSDREIHDNIVGFWRPKDKLQAKGEYGFTYRLHWCAERPGLGDLARVMETRSGAGWDRKNRLFVLELAGEKLKGLTAEAPPKLEVTASPGKVLHPVAQPNPETGGWRVSFDLDPAGAKLCELRAVLSGPGGPVSETWLYRWTS